MNITLPQQRNSRKAKENPDWYIPTMDYWITSAMASSKENTRRSLQFASGELDTATYIKAFLPFNKSEDTDISEFLKKFPEELINGDFITPIKEKTVADYMNLPYRPQVMVNDPQAALKRDSELRKALTDMYQQMYINLLNAKLKAEEGAEPGAESGVPSKDVPPIEQFAEQFIKEWSDDRTVKAHKLLSLINSELSFDTLRYEAFLHWWSTEQFYTFRYLKGNTVCKDLISPLNAYPVSNGKRFNEDFDAFVIADTITYGVFRDNYYDFLKPADRAIIDKHIQSSDFTANGIISIPPTDLAVRLDHTALKNIHNDHNPHFIGADRLVNRKIVIFKTEVEVTMLHRINAIEEFESVEVSPGYVLDPLNGDISVNKHWRQEAYVGYKFGDGLSSFYIAPLPNPVQQYDEDLNTCKLPVGGKYGISPDLPLKPIPMRIVVNQALDRLYQFIIDKELSKYKSYVELIPKSMLADDEAGTAKQKFLYRLLDGSIIYDETKISVNEVATGYRIVGNPGLERYIDVLMKLKEANKQEAFSYSHMNSDRFGDIDTRSGVTNVNNNIVRAKLGSALMIYMFNQAMLREHIADMEYSKIAYNRGKVGHFTDADGMPVFVTVDPEEHINTKYLLTIDNSVKAEEKLLLYKNLAQSLGQNGDTELSAIAIDSDNTVEIRRKIEAVSKARRDFEQSQNEGANNAKLEAANIVAQIKEKDNQIKLTIAQLHEENENYRTQLKTSQNPSNEATTALQSRLDKLMLDRDNLSLKQQQLYETINNNNQTNSIKKEQIRSNERIAKTKLANKPKKVKK